MADLAARAGLLYLVSDALGALLLTVPRDAKVEARVGEGDGGGPSDAAVAAGDDGDGHGVSLPERTVSQTVLAQLYGYCTQMGRAIKQASIHVVRGNSLVVPLVIEGLPEAIDALGMRWQRKREFHLTALAARVIDELDDGEDIWDVVSRVASGRHLGTVTASDEFRRVRDPEDSGLQTLIVMVDCPGIEVLYNDLSRELEMDLTPPPAHVTLYSTEPASGIGIVDQSELAQRAPPLGAAEQEEVRRAIGFP